MIMDTMTIEIHRPELIIELPTLRCAKCGYAWSPRTNKPPKRCPECNCYDYTQPPGKPGRKKGGKNRTDRRRTKK